MAVSGAAQKIEGIFGTGDTATQRTAGYQNVVNQAYGNLGQSLEDIPHMVNGQMVGDRAGKTSEFITNLASTFADRFYQKTGQLPNEDQIRQFVSQNATSGNAAKFITGGLNADQMATLSDYHIQSNPDILGTQGNSTQQLQSLPQQVNDLYGKERENLSSAFDSAYAPIRKNVIEDEAALGRLRSPASIPNIAQADIAKAQGLSQALAGSYGNQAGASLEIGKTAAQMAQQNQQFGQQMGLQNRAFANQQDIEAYNQGLQRQQMGLAAQLGRQQAGAGQNNGLMGGFTGAASGAASGALLGSVVPGLGTGIGALVGGLSGGLSGYFGSKR